MVNEYNIALILKVFPGLVVAGTIVLSSPLHVQANILSSIAGMFVSNTDAAAPESNGNSQTMPILQAAINSDPNPFKGSEDIALVAGSALISENGPAGASATNATVDKTSSDTISVYTVRDGDTLSAIASMFNISANTIMWANDLKSKTLKIGQQLVILPINGVKHVVVKGETLSSIAKKYKGDMQDIREFNNLGATAVLSIGDEIIIPEGEVSIDVPASAVSQTARAIAKLPLYDGYYTRPVIGGVRTQGVHGHNGIDVGLKVGSPVYASAGGTVILSKSSGYNGGYGQYIIISHPNGTQTVYGHLSQNFVSVGTKVVQGQNIGLSGNTGRSTGPHIHFEIRGARNPF
ncbi:MAG: peptidoglycan DD-metalloendopeptidase family protein [Candidatus Paceibacterota bacterium]|jgi:murein DD-endopeptidase MepM/ murein hydrolase activator NlpD